MPKLTPSREAELLERIAFLEKENALLREKIELLVRKQQECCVAARDVTGRHGNPVGEIDDVVRAVHDDKTPQQAGMFNRWPAYASGVTRLEEPGSPSVGPRSGGSSRAVPATPLGEHRADLVSGEVVL